MSDTVKKPAVIVKKEVLADGIVSMWLKEETIVQGAKAGQFVSVYCKNASRLLPRPISICEIDMEKSALRMVYRVTGEKTGTKQFSEMKPGDQIPVIGPMGNGFPLEEAKGKKAFLMGGGIGVPPILELAKEIDCAEKQIVVGYRDAHTFLKEEFEQNGSLYIATEDGSAGTKGNVMDAICEQGLDADRCRCSAQSRRMQRKKAFSATFPWKSIWRAESEPVLDVYARQRM